MATFDLGALEHWVQGGVGTVLYNTDDTDLGALEHWVQGGVITVLHQQSSAGGVTVPIFDHYYRMQRAS